MEIIIVPIKFNETAISDSIDKFNQLNLRLRVMLTIASLAVIFMLFDLTWFSSSNLEISQSEREITQLEKQSQDLVNFQMVKNKKIIDEKNNPNKIKLKQLNEEIKIIYKRLENKTINLVKPEDMAKVLKRILTFSSTLKIKKLTKNNTEEILNSNDKESGKRNSEKDIVKLYRHSFELILEGDYSSTYLFLKQLENMKKKISFDLFEYTVEKHPAAEIKLQVSTISLQREWIGG